MELFSTQPFAQIPGQIAMDTDAVDVVRFEIGRRSLTGTVSARFTDSRGGQKVTVQTVEGEYTLPVECLS